MTAIGVFRSTIMIDWSGPENMRGYGWVRAVLCGHIIMVFKQDGEGPEKVKVPINPKFIFRLNKSFYNLGQNGANNFVFGQNRNFLFIFKAWFVCPTTGLKGDWD